MRIAFSGISQSPPRSVPPTAQLIGGIILAVGAVYGFLSLSETAGATPQSFTATSVNAIATTTSFDALTLEAQGVFITDITLNKILYTKNADVQLPLASLTKVMLVLAVSEGLSLDDTITISAEAVAKSEGLDLAPGDMWRVQDLIAYTLVASSNAGAEALAEAANEKIRARYPQAPETDATVWRMNSLAQELGLSKTYFLNASGLDLSPTQPSAMGSARDVSVLLAYAYETRPELFESTANESFVTGPINGPRIIAENTNDALYSIPGLHMGKTGFTDLAGGNLSVVFEVEPDRVMVGTVLGSSFDGRFADMIALVRSSQEYRQR